MDLETIVKQNLPVIYNKEFAVMQIEFELRQANQKPIEELFPSQFSDESLSVSEINRFLDEDKDFEPIICQRCNEIIGYNFLYNKEPEDPFAFKVPTSMHIDSDIPCWTVCKNCTKETLYKQN